MSSTNRGYDRHKSDYYVTPHQPIRDFLSAFLVEEQINRPDRLIWLDPCAGGDEDTSMSYPTVLEDAFNPTITTLDIREDSLAEIKGDCLELDIKGNFDVIITNPPFNIALDIIKKALNDVDEGGYVIMLLRLNFYGSNERFSFFSDNMPKHCFVHHKRISFITDKMKKELKGQGKSTGSDSIEYAHFVWQKDYKGNHSKLHLI